MKKQILLIACLGSVFAFGQIQNSEFTTLDDLAFYVKTNNPNYLSAEGSQYLNDEFTPAKINGISKTQFVRFNVPDNIIEIKKSNGDIMGISFSEGLQIQLQDGSGKEYITHAYINSDDKKDKSFFEKLYDDESFVLYLKEKITFMPAKKARSGYEPAVAAKFVKGNDTFYVLGLGSDPKILTTLPKKRKPFATLFGEHSGTIEKMIKKEKLDIKKENDIVTILKAYYSLL